MTSSADVESQQPAGKGKGTGRCANLCMLGSVVALYALVLAAGLVGFWIVKELRAEIESARPPQQPQALMDTRVPGSGYKMQNLAHLRPTQSTIAHSKVMTWEPIQYGQVTTVGSHFRYDSKQSSLTVSQEGSYLLYVQLTLTCVYKCAPGPLSITFEDQDQNQLLDCTLDLPDTPSGQVSRKCWTVIPYLKHNTRLLAKMSTKIDPNCWSVQLNQSEFGIFLVDGPAAD